jgi:hypothetical protein
MLLVDFEGLVNINFLLLVAIAGLSNGCNIFAIFLFRLGFSFAPSFFSFLVVAAIFFLFLGGTTAGPTACPYEMDIDAAIRYSMESASVCHSQTYT